MATQVEERNNWEYRTYYAGKVELTQRANKHEIVCFPNGDREVLKIHWVEETHTYYDHGHQGSATSVVPYVQIEHRGLRLPVKLSRLKIEVK